MRPYSTRAHRNTTTKKTSSREDREPSPSEVAGCWYDLYCVVVHKGKLDAGHYYCYCKRPVPGEGDQWFKFNDGRASLAGEKEVLEAEAYLLFYVVRSFEVGGGGKKDEGKDEEGEDGEGVDNGVE
jgi:ubiquitin C-terminal hydrolase